MVLPLMVQNEYGVLSTYVGNLVRDLNVDGEVTVGMPHYEIPVLCEYVTGGHNVRRNKGADGTKCDSASTVLCRLIGVVECADREVGRLCCTD